MDPGTAGTSGTDAFKLARFVTAQDERSGYPRALAEVRAGRKLTHWIWWVFPQLAGLGRSETSRYYSISSLAEARAYLAHPVLGPRLLEVTAAVMTLAGRSAGEIMGSDDVKLRSCMTLFARAAPEEALFRNVIATFFAGVGDELTERLLGQN